MRSAPTSRSRAWDRDRRAEARTGMTRDSVMESSEAAGPRAGAAAAAFRRTRSDTSGSDSDAAVTRRSTTTRIPQGACLSATVTRPDGSSLRRRVGRVAPSRGAAARGPRLGPTFAARRLGASAPRAFPGPCVASCLRAPPLPAFVLHVQAPDHSERADGVRRPWCYCC